MRNGFPDIASPFLISVCAIGVRLGGSLLLLIQPVRDRLESPLCVGHHVLYIFQFLLSWVDYRVFGHDMAVVIHEDTHGTVAHWGRLGVKRRMIINKEEIQGMVYAVTGLAKDLIIVDKNQLYTKTYSKSTS